MQAEIRRKMATGLTALNFSKVHPEVSAGFATTLKGLEGLVANADGLATRQRAGIIAERNAHAQKRELKDAIGRTHLHHLFRVAKVAGTAEWALPLKFRQPTERRSLQGFRTAARAMVVEAQVNREVLIGYGMSEELVADLVLPLDQFDAAMDAAVAGRSAHVGARVELEVVVQEMMEVVEVLDGRNRFRFKDDAELLAAWESAGNVVTLKPGTADGPTSVPAQVKPAA